jgi:hypothetical protein
VIVQLSIQAVDVSILAIAITTFLAVIKPRLFDDWSSRKSTFITLATWGFPVTTSLVVLGLDKYEPASGGWCWISRKPVYLRYGNFPLSALRECFANWDKVMTHGWRYLIILIILVLYTYLYFFLRKDFRALAAASGGSPSRRGGGFFKRKKLNTFNTSHSEPRPTQDEGDSVKLSTYTSSRPIGGPALFVDTSNAHGDRYNKIKKVLLMKAYPTWFVILWIPGLVNRAMEATGHKSKVVALLQTSTAFIGLANTVTYGWNEGLIREYKRRDARHKDKNIGPLDASGFS